MIQLQSWTTVQVGHTGWTLAIRIPRVGDYRPISLDLRMTANIEQRKVLNTSSAGVGENYDQTTMSLRLLSVLKTAACMSGCAANELYYASTIMSNELGQESDGDVCSREMTSRTRREEQIRSQNRLIAVSVELSHLRLRHP